MTLLVHVALVACLWLRWVRGVPVPDLVLMGILAAVPIWAVACTWRQRSWRRAFVLGPGVLLAGFAAFIVWMVVNDDFGRWTGLVVFVGAVLELFYFNYCAMVFDFAKAIRR